MRKIEALKFILPALAALMFATSALAERANPYIVMAQSAWSAFQCSVLAEKANNMAEQKRLFDYGYAQGKKFIAALEAGMAKKEDVPGAAPFSMLLLVRGPTPDFALGRIFEAALRAALEDVFAASDAYTSEGIQQSTATREFWKRNCSLIGS
ncbi:MAG: hypothetical protein AMJ64_04100 [Betaproteobacteria bacterium SG8_39]|nr:MAG: hypothetical protein AMJ64_04100 [Betaproteobacteria bacterium SG8_39]